MLDDTRTLSDGHLRPEYESLAFLSKELLIKYETYYMTGVDYKKGELYSFLLNFNSVE